MENKHAAAFKETLALPRYFDHDYAKKSAAFHAANANKSHTSATYQSTTLAMKNGLINGAIVGSTYGLWAAIYVRKFGVWPRYALGIGAASSLLFGSSAWYRFDI